MFARATPTIVASVLLALCLATTACTLNVTSFDREVSSRSAAGVTALSTSLGTIERELGGAPLYVRGADRDDALATAHLSGLRGSGTSEEGLIAGWSLTFAPTLAGAVELAVGPGVSPASFLDRLTVEVPHATDVTVSVEATDVQIDDLTGRAQVTTTSGNVRARTDGVVELTSVSGSMIVEAAAGTMTTVSGNMHLSIAGWVNVSAESGSVVGDIGDGGSITTSAGSIDVELTAAPTRDLYLSTDAGSIVLRVPADAPMTLDVATGGGGILVRLPGTQYDGWAFTGTNAGGGPLIHVRAGGGSIHVVAED